MQILSAATERFLAPIDKSRLGNAILKLSLKIHQQDAPIIDSKKSDKSLDDEHLSSVKSFILEVYEEISDSSDPTVKVLRTPNSPSAYTFVDRRFKHGHKRLYTLNNQHIMHLAYEVPATDYSLYLFLHTWTGNRLVDESARLHLSNMIAHETALDKCAQRSARYKTRLTELLQVYHEQVKELEFSSESVSNSDYEIIDPDKCILNNSEFFQSLAIDPFLTHYYKSPNTTNTPNSTSQSNNSTTPYLTAYQLVCATNAIQSSNYSLFMRPGCGKTAPAIALIDYVASYTQKTSGRPARILILMPKNIRQNWKSEIEYFSRSGRSANSNSGSTGHSITILTGASTMERTFNLISALDPNIDSTSTDDETPQSTLSTQTPLFSPPVPPANIILANYEAAVNTPFSLQIEWDLVIIDESHSISNFSTKRAKYALKLRDASLKHLILTGTPIRNNPFDLYTQFEFLNKGVSGFGSYAKFKDFFGVWKNIPGKGFRQLEGLQNIPLLQERLAKYSFIMELEEAIPSLPSSTEDIMEVSLTPEQVKVYKQIATKLQAELESASNTDSNRISQLTVKSHLSKLLRLAQVTSGFSATDEDGLYRFDPNPKLELLVSEVKDFLELNPYAKVEIWCHFQENIKQIYQRFNFVESIKSVMFYGETKESDRQIAIAEFNCNPDTRIFIGSPASGGVGLNLLGYDPKNPSKYKTNCEWAIFYSSDWSQVSRKQAMARARRMGTRAHMRYTDFIVPNSIDTRILNTVKSKIEMSHSIEDIRKMLQESLNPQVNGD